LAEEPAELTATVAGLAATDAEVTVPVAGLVVLEDVVTVVAVVTPPAVALMFTDDVAGTV
jgi:hypothetical protein